MASEGLKAQVYENPFARVLIPESGLVSSLVQTCRTTFLHSPATHWKWKAHLQMQICVTLLTPSYHFTLFFHFPSSPGAPSIAWATAAFAMPLGPHTLNSPAILSQPASGGFWHWASIQEDSVLGTLQAHFQDGGREGWQCQGSRTNKLRGPSCPFPNHLCKRTSPLVSHIHFPCIPEEDEKLGFCFGLWLFTMMSSDTVFQLW